MGNSSILTSGKPKVLEKDIKKAIKDYLILFGWYYIYVLQGMGAMKGISDMIAVKCIGGQPVTLFIEVKTGTGRQSEDQKDFEKNINDQKGHYILARSVEDVDEYICQNITGRKNLIF